MIELNQTPQVAGGDQSAASQNFGDKRTVAALAGNMSVRWVDGELQKGMPHLRLGKRRVRFDIEEVRAWLKEQYGQQRRGKIAA
jgi:hypothetical protein